MSEIIPPIDTSRQLVKPAPSGFWPWPATILICVMAVCASWVMTTRYTFLPPETSGHRWTIRYDRLTGGAERLRTPRMDEY